MEDLVLFPETEAGYVELLEKSGFTVLSVCDDSAAYLWFNQNIVDRLRDPEQLGTCSKCFKEKELEASIGLITDEDLDLTRDKDTGRDFDWFEKNSDLLSN